jgi:hypothetical protein
MSPREPPPARRRWPRAYNASSGRATHRGPIHDGWRAGLDLRTPGRMIRVKRGGRTFGPMVAAIALWPWSLAGSDLPPWRDVDDLPLPSASGSVIVQRGEQSILAEPSAAGERRGTAKMGAQLPWFGAKRGSGCAARWINVGPLAWCARTCWRSKRARHLKRARPTTRPAGSLSAISSWGSGDRAATFGSRMPKTSRPITSSSRVSQWRWSKRGSRAESATCERITDSGSRCAISSS